MSIPASVVRAPRGVRSLLVGLIAVAILPLGLVQRPAVAAEGHLVISEVVTGGATASDELIELYNPSAAALPLEGLELVYVSASGATVTRRAAWEVGAPVLGPGAHLLVANDAGMFAGIADAVYAGGMAATGGSVALRILGATAAVDAVGWGAASGAWLEGRPASAPPPGSSIERLPGGSAGSTVDADDNAADFVVRPLPNPQNAGSPPVPEPTVPTLTPSPSATPIPTPASSGTPTPTATPTPSDSPSPAAGQALPIRAARGLPHGTTVTIEGIALAGSAFTDGGGYLADASDGIAVLLDTGSFARGDRVIVTGTVDDRFAQRTLRAVTASASPGAEPPLPVSLATGSVNEAVEARLVRLEATVDGGPTNLSGGVAFDLDDGSGVARVVVAGTTGIDTSGWTDGRRVAVVGVVGQRDSSGTGTTGYRVQPRDPADVALLAPPPSTPTPGASATSQPTSPIPTASASASAGEVTTVAAARAAPTNARLVLRGVVTLASGTIEAESAVLQDATGAILLRLGDEAGQLLRGELIEVDGVRSTKSGMESLRVSAPPRRLGTSPDPAERSLLTGDAGEAEEAQVVLVRGALVANARRASSGTVSFEIDDGSGPLRVVLGAALQAGDEHLAGGSWVEVIGVLGQETSGSEPTQGYRVWPRDQTEVRVLAAATDASGDVVPAGSDEFDERSWPSDGGAAPSDSLAAIGLTSLAELRVGATLVTAAWDELEVAGLLWDGERLVAIEASSHELLERVIAARPPPVSLELGRLAAAGMHARIGIPVVALGAGPDDVVPGSAPPAAPLSRLPATDAPAAWVSMIGQLSVADGRTTIAVDGVEVTIEQLCDQGQPPFTGVASVRGIALAGAARLIVPCDGIGPAPALTLAWRSASATADPVAPPRMLAASETSSAAGSIRRALAVALLAAGVAVLLLAALAGRRLGRPEGGHAGSDAAPEVADAPTGPQLTLLRVPDERGP